MKKDKYFVGIENFKEVNNDLLEDAITSTIEDGAIIYAKTTKNNNCVFVSGNIGAMICLIADMVILIAKNSGAPISAILTSITHIIWNVRGTLR